MQIPNLPTDNLYKFIALAGLIIIILIFFVTVWLGHTFTLQLIEAKEELALYEVERDYLETTFLDNREYLKTLPLTKRIEEEKLFVKNKIDSTKKLKQIKSQIEKLDYIQSMKEINRVFSFIGIVLGSILIYFGFSLWYTRLQKYQDQIIKNEAQKQLQINAEQN